MQECGHGDHHRAARDRNEELHDDVVADLDQHEDLDMPSASDIFNELKGANQRLDNILAAEQAVAHPVCGAGGWLDRPWDEERLASVILVLYSQGGSLR